MTEESTLIKQLKGNGRLQTHIVPNKMPIMNLDWTNDHGNKGIVKIFENKKRKPFPTPTFLLAGC